MHYYHSDYIQLPLFVPTASFLARGSGLELCVAFSHVSLVFFSMEGFLSFSLTLVTLKITSQLFLEYPLILICFLMIRFSLCIFSKNITEVMLCFAYDILS